MDGFMAFAAHLPAGRAKFFFSLVLQKDGSEDRNNALFQGKTGSCKENKI